MELPKRKPNRLTDFYYSSPNAYFITICTINRKNLFWTDSKAFVGTPQNLPLTPCGLITDKCIRDIPRFYPTVSVDHYVIMPNHIHLLLQINSDVDGRSMIAPTISTVVRMMKGAVSKQAGFSVWQKGFHDHVVRNDTDYLEIWEYIEGNPGKWSADKFYPVQM